MSFKIIYLSVLPFEVQTAAVNISNADIPMLPDWPLCHFKITVNFEMHYSMGQHR